MSVRAYALALAVTATTLAACDLTPDVGPPAEYRCLDADSNPGVAVSWNRDIVPVLQRAQVGCARCHDPARPNPVGVQVGGLDLSSRATTLKGGARSAANIVVGGSPCRSVLYQKLLEGPPFGGRMPLDGPPFLSVTEVGLVHDWIAEGARDN